MSNTKKEFSELSKAAQAKRIAKYQAQDAKYGLKEALFRVTHVSRHADKTFDNGTTASFGYNVVPVKGYDTADFTKNEFTWVNQLINLSTGSKVVEAMEQLAQDVNPQGKSALVSIKYKKSAKGYINVNSVFRRDYNKASNASGASANA